MFPLSCNWRSLIFGVDIYRYLWLSLSRAQLSLPSKLWSCGDPTEPTPWCIWSPWENPAGSAKWGSIEIYTDFYGKIEQVEWNIMVNCWSLGYLLYVYRQKCICGLNQRPMRMHKSENIVSKTHAKKLTHRTTQEYLGSNATSNKQ